MGSAPRPQTKWVVLAVFLTCASWATSQQLQQQSPKNNIEMAATLLNMLNNNVDGAANNFTIWMDFAVNMARKVLREKNMDVVSVPDVKESLDEPPIKNLRNHWTVTIFLTITNGRLGSLTSLERRSDFVFSHEAPATVHFEARMGLKTLKFTSNYKLEVRKAFTVSGTIIADVAYNEILISGALVPTKLSHCEVVVKDFQLTKIGKINLKLTGMGLVNKYYSLIATSITNKYHNELRRLVENKVRSVLAEQIEVMYCTIGKIGT